jgi:hypothetical protein
MNLCYQSTKRLATKLVIINKFNNPLKILTT